MATMARVMQRALARHPCPLRRERALGPGGIARPGCGNRRALRARDLLRRLRQRLRPLEHELQRRRAPQHAIGAQDVKLLLLQHRPRSGSIPGWARHRLYRPLDRLHRPDALCVSGLIAGASTDAQTLKAVKDVVPAFIVFANTGVKLSNVRQRSPSPMAPWLAPRSRQMASSRTTSMKPASEPSWTASGSFGRPVPLRIPLSGLQWPQGRSDWWSAKLVRR